MNWFTADWHLGSRRILKYARRPFATAMNARLAYVSNAREAIANDDSDGFSTLFHVGDFSLMGTDNHGSEPDVAEFDVDCFREKRGMAKENIALVLVWGNHDKTADVGGLLVDLSRTIRNVRVSHYPTISRGCRYALCGHVHNAWLVKEFNGTININVGVDVWNYKPVSDSQLAKLVDGIEYVLRAFPSLRKGLVVKDMMGFSTLYRRAEAEFAKARAARSEERKAKKGLTKEECERRRREAMLAKGLDPDSGRQRKPAKKAEAAKMDDHETNVQFGACPPDVLNPVNDGCCMGC